MLTFEPGTGDVRLHRLATGLPRLKAILVVSAHWENDDLRVTGAAAPDIWRDFYSFPPLLYAVRYPAKGAPALAQRTIELLQTVGLPVQADPQQPFDCGTQMPLSLMYPQAGVPVLQLSLPNRLGPALQNHVDQVLRRLRGEDVLLIGSGNITHSPGELDWHTGPETIVPRAQEFRDWMVREPQTGDEAAFHGYRRQVPWTTHNHPNDKHLLPLFFARGAGGGEMRVEHSDFTLGSLGMDIYRFNWQNFLWDWRRALALRRKLGGLGWQPGSRE